MTEERLALTELLEKAGEGDFLRAVAEAVLQLLMEADVEGLVGAGRYERSGERDRRALGHRSGSVYCGNAAWKLSGDDRSGGSVADSGLLQHGACAARLKQTRMAGALRALFEHQDPCPRRRA